MTEDWMHKAVTGRIEQRVRPGQASLPEGAIEQVQAAWARSPG
jgi:hypothetical protein